MSEIEHLENHDPLGYNDDGGYRKYYSMEERVESFFGKNIDKMAKEIIRLARKVDKQETALTEIKEYCYDNHGLGRVAAMVVNCDE